MRNSTVFIGLLLTALMGQNSMAASLRCGDDLITSGDTTTEVLSRCGEPLSREVIAVASSGIKRKSTDGRNTTLEVETEKVEQWIYDPGPGSLLRVLHFRGGELVSIENGERSAPLARSSSRAQVEAGDTKAQVLRVWGEPVSQEELGLRSTEIRQPLPEAEAEKVTETSEKLERWIYEFGPGEFRRHVLFQAGRVIRVEVGERQ